MIHHHHRFSFHWSCWTLILLHYCCCQCWLFPTKGVVLSFPSSTARPRSVGIRITTEGRSTLRLLPNHHKSTWYDKSSSSSSLSCDLWSTKMSPNIDKSRFSLRWTSQQPSESSLLFSSTLLTEGGEGERDPSSSKSLWTKIRRVLLWPWKFLIEKPWSYILQNFFQLESLDEDGTMTVTKNSTESISSKDDDDDDDEMSSRSRNMMQAKLAATEDLLKQAEGLLESTILANQKNQSRTTDDKNDWNLRETERLIQQAENLVESSMNYKEPSNANDETTKKATTFPSGTRWAVAAPEIDLSGEWELMVSDEFKQEYDRYLSELGQPMLVRSVALGIISLTTETVEQADQGKSLLIRGRNVRGTWDRTLVASGTEVGVDDFSPLQIPVMSADSESVLSESWWENQGTIHVSWLRGVKKYGGGAFESRRFLNEDGNYVCESTFFPSDTSKSPNRIIWKFRRQPGTKETSL